MKVIGEVIKIRYAPGSKSERDAVMLRTICGDYLLKREEGNPFKDEVLEAMVGNTICAKARCTDVTIIISEWEIVKE